MSKIPPDLPPRRPAGANLSSPPKLPPRPGHSTLTSPVRPGNHDWPGNAEHEETVWSEVAPAASSSFRASSSLDSTDDIDGAGSSSTSISLFPVLQASAAMAPEDGFNGSASRLLRPLEVPTIVHTSASSPEVDTNIERFPMPRTTSDASNYSTASQSSTGSRPDIERRGSSDSHRPFVNLYGRASSEKHYQEALEELKALEVDEFLTRASKHMEEVNFQGRTTPIRQPRLEDYPQKDPLARYFKFGEDWLCSQAETYLPRDLLAVEKPGRFSFSRSRIALERLYVLVPPSLLEKLLAGHIVNLYRWKDPIRTGKWAGLYLALWYYDQIPAAFFTFIGYLALKPKLFPPTHAEIRHRLAERRARSKEAQELDEDLSKRQKVGQVSKSLAQSVGVAAMMGGIGIGYSPHRHHHHDEGSRSVTPDDGYSSDSEMDAPHPLVPMKRHRGKFGMYRLIREMLDRFGPSTMMLINDGADYFEKSKNFVLWRRPAATKQSLVVMAVWIICLSILSARVQLKLLLLWVWFQFFIVWPIQDRHPRYRRALNPWWWLLWNVPNDAESALEILKARAAAAAADPASDKYSRPRSVSNASHRSIHSLRRRSSSASSHSTTASFAEGAVQSRHFALLKGMPGHLQFTQSEISFSSVRGLRSLSSRLWKKSSKSETMNDASSGLSVTESLKRQTAFRYPLDQVTSVKKESRFDIGVFDTDGIQITFADSTVIRLASVNKRDEAFAYILAHSPGRGSET